MEKFTLADLEEARARARRVEDFDANDSGNNPNKYRSALQATASRVHAIEAALKAQGDLPMSDHEKIEAELDRLFPHARSREIVEHEGQRYQRRFYPLSTSRSGKTVMEWGRCWTPVADLSPEQRLQATLGSLHPEAKAGDVVEHEGKIYCRRLYRWRGGRTSLYWKCVDALPQSERLRCRLNWAFPNAQGGEVVEFDGRRYQRQTRRRKGEKDSFIWKALK